MKKVISLILVLSSIVLVFSGCGNQEKEIKEPQSNVVENSEKNEQESQGIGFNTETYRVPMTQIYIDLPSTPYHLVELGFTKAAFIYDEQCISVTRNKLSQAITLEQAQKDNVEEYGLSIENQFHLNSLTVKEEEYVTINGVDMYRFEGEFNCTRSAGQYTQYAVGYTFIMDGLPCSLIGTALNRYEEQPNSVIKDVEEKVDAVIKTVRNQP
mgnify:CR=1 FL=1